MATGLFTLWIAVLSLPMLGGKWLAGPWSDQYTAGYPFRSWGAEWWRRAGHVPLWNPEIFGGLPFLGAGHGEAFYPFSFLRLLLPTMIVTNLEFVVHYVLAGLFTYLLLRLLRVSWSGAAVAGVAYELSGIIGSYPSPGHDAKLIVSALLPLACIGLLVALRDRRSGGYALITLAVAGSLFSAQYQVTYYLLIAIGVFALYVALDEAAAEPARARLARLSLAMGAVLLGFGIAMIHILPFFSYIPFSPRATGYHGFQGSTTFAIPWEHVPEFFLKNFAGSRETYWGSNSLKLHSEYLGLPVVALAILGGSGAERRLLKFWLGGIGLLFLLISLGAGTPFYRLWWAVMPYVRHTRAPGMAFFVVAFIVALFAGLGADRIARKDGVKALMPWFVAAGLVALLAVTGGFGAIAQSLASSASQAAGRDLMSTVRANQPAIMWGALSSALALAAAAAVGSGFLRGRLTPRVFGLALPLVLGTDLWLNAQRFWTYSRPYGRDQIIDRIAGTPLPFRVLDTGVYPGSALMAFDIPQVLGYHGNELRFYDDLLGGKNEWTNLRFLPLWDLLAVSYVIVPQDRPTDSIPGFRLVLAAAQTSAGVAARLFERVTPAPYARVVPAAVKGDSDHVVPTLLDPRLDYNRLVLLTPDQPITPAPVTAMPTPSPSHATVTRSQPGRLTVTLDPTPPAPSYLVVAENWYPDWHASVDGAPAAVLRGDQTLMTVPVPAGARRVELAFRSRDYERGRFVTLVSLVLLVGLLAAPAASRLAGRG